nr:SRPBCC family protein [uncultured Noviherbaspirillum sp.]
MASGIVAMQRGKSSRSGRPGAGESTGGSMQVIDWIPVALGAAAIAAKLGGRNKGAAALARTPGGGAAAVSAVRGVPPVLGKALGKAQGGEPEVERSITIGKTADELRHSWLDPRTLPQIMAGFATVHAADDGRMHWKLEGPLGRSYEWDSEALDQPGEAVGWRSLSNAAISNEGTVRFHPAPAGRGTVATLRLRFDAPRGALGEGLLQLLGTTPLDLVADGALRRFKNLVETGEIPTTVRQPAARADTR